MNTSYLGRPNPKHAAPYAIIYLNLCDRSEDLLEELQVSLDESLEIWGNISETKSIYSYAEGKWTIKGVLSHIVDTERIFQYRALRLSRMDATLIEGFEQDDYVAHSNLENRTFQSILNEFKLVRQNSIELLKTMRSDQLDFLGLAGGNPLSARSAFWLLVGHARHHENVLLDKYF